MEEKQPLKFSENGRVIKPSEANFWRPQFGRYEATTTGCSLARRKPIYIR